MKLLLESTEFMDALNADVMGAATSIYAQTLSFEDDDGGRALAALFEAKPGLDRRLIVDSYTRHIVNDRCIWMLSNYLDPVLRREWTGTFRLVDKLRNAGTLVKWVNPLGFLLRKISARNHRKIIGVDRRSAYIGGINFSAHNFEWHDLMLRFDEPEIVNFLHEDFLQTWEGKNQGVIRDFGNVQIALMDGKNSPKFVQPVIDLLRSAKRKIFVVSPYLSTPYYEVLGEMSRRGVEVVVLAPAANNWGLYDAYTRDEVRQHGLKLYYYPGRMNHMKGILVDDEVLVLGSSNFDFFSHHLHQELVAVIREKSVVQDFIERVEKPDMALSRPADEEYDFHKARRARWVLGFLFKFMHLLNKGRFVPPEAPIKD